jgi:hypothetical protein
MRTWWARLGWWSLIAGVIGCRTLGPELKPPKQPEILATPPVGDARYDSPMLPKEAYANTYDPTKKAIGQGGLPKGGMGSPNMARGY